jgi:hypothetical protein
MKFIRMRDFVILLILFVISRAIFIATFDWLNGPYHHEMVVGQFLIADAKWHGYDFSHELNLGKRVIELSENRHATVPIEEFKNIERTYSFSIFPAKDVPGYGYLIAYSSRLLGTELTSRYAFLVQLLVELIGLVLFTCCISTLLNRNIALTFGLLYLIGFPFLQLISGQPIRDMFGVFGYIIATTAVVYYSTRKHLEFKSTITILSMSVVFAGILWIRPSAYYFIFLLALYVLFMKGKTLPGKILVIILLIMPSQLIFSNQYKDFNVKYYGTHNTYFLGWGLWIGLGNAKDENYEFVYGDRDFLKWARMRTGDNTLELGDVEINKLGLKHALETLRNDPFLYVRAMYGRVKILIAKPLSLDYWKGYVPRRTNKLSYLDYILNHPRDVIHYLIQIYGFVFFWVSMACLLTILITRHCRVGFDNSFYLLLLPFLYHLCQFIFYVPDPRHFVSGAWILCLPIAYYLHINKANYKNTRLAGL